MYIEARALTKRYDSFYALMDLNLNVEGSRCVGYLGPNGAGKTTTLKLFTNLLRPTGGEAIINGYSVREEPRKALAEVGALVETPEFYPYLTPVEILSFQCDLRGVSRREIPHVLETVGLHEYRNMRVGKFSRGMKQRLALAVALVTNPGVLLLDEPTTGMDPMGMAEIRALIKGLKKENILIFLSSHLLHEVTEICDEVAMLHRGRLVHYDTIENIEKRFAGQAVIVDFAEDVGEDSLGDLPSAVGVERISARKYRITFRGGVEEQHAILRELIGRGLKVINYRADALPLERAYMELLGGGAGE